MKMNLVLRLTLCWICSSAFAGDELSTLCVVRELTEVQVPARRDGVLERLDVRRGQRVASDELIAQLESSDTKLRLEVTRAELRQSQAKAKNDGEVLASRAGVERAEQEQQLLDELGNDAVYLERFRMRNNLQKAEAELRTAENQYETEQLTVDVKRAETEVLENDIRQAKVFSPVNGVVRELSKKQGEWVKQGEPILIVTRMDRLLAEGFLDSAVVSANEVIGKTARVRFQISGQQTVVLEGLIVDHASPKLELDGKFPVWVEFDNRLVSNANGKQGWLIRPGMKAELTLSP